MYKKKRTGQERKNRAVQVCEFLAEEERHTMADVKEEFGISKETARRDINYLCKLIVDGEFSNNPSYEKVITLKYLKAKNRLKSNVDIAAAHQRMLIKQRMKKQLVRH